jgi:hypothetical protein
LDGKKIFKILMMGKWIIKHSFRLMINSFEINVWNDAQLSIHETVLKLNAKGLEVRVINTIDMVNRRKALDDIKPYIPGKPLWEVQEELGMKSGIKLALNGNPLGPLPKALML